MFSVDSGSSLDPRLLVTGSSGLIGSEAVAHFSFEAEIAKGFLDVMPGNLTRKVALGLYLICFLRIVGSFAS